MLTEDSLYASSFLNVLHTAQTTHEIRTLQALPNGNYLVFGQATIGTSTDLFVGLLSPLGEIIKMQLYKTQDNQEAGTLAWLPRGGFYISGGTQNDWFLAKLRTPDAMLWSKAIRGSDIETIAQIKATPDQGCIILGSTAQADAKDDMLVAKMSPDGQVQWSLRLGGEGEERGREIVTMLDGSYILLCDTTSFRQPANHGDMCLVKLSPDGDVVWARFIDSPGRERALTLHAVSATEILISGTTDKDARSHADSWVIKFDTEREAVLWSKLFSRDHLDGEDFPVRGIARNGDLLLGGFVTHEFNNNIFFVRTTSEGEVTWAKLWNLPGAGNVYSMTTEPDRFIAAGKVAGYSGHSGTDAFALKVDTNSSNPQNCHTLATDSVVANVFPVSIRPAMFTPRNYTLAAYPHTTIPSASTITSRFHCATPAPIPAEPFLPTVPPTHLSTTTDPQTNTRRLNPTSTFFNPTTALDTATPPLPSSSVNDTISSTTLSGNDIGIGFAIGLGSVGTLLGCIVLVLCWARRQKHRHNTQSANLSRTATWFLFGSVKKQPANAAELSPPPSAPEQTLTTVEADKKPTSQYQTPRLNRRPNHDHYQGGTLLAQENMAREKMTQP